MSCSRHNRAGTTISFMYCCFVLLKSKDGRSMEPRQLRLPGFTRLWALRIAIRSHFPKSIETRSAALDAPRSPLIPNTLPSRRLTHKIAPSSTHSFRGSRADSGWTNPKPRLRCLCASVLRNRSMEPRKLRFPGFTRFWATTSAPAKAGAQTGSKGAFTAASERDRPNRDSFVRSR
jgi:hypothetical protein